MASGTRVGCLSGKPVALKVGRTAAGLLSAALFLSVLAPVAVVGKDRRPGDPKTRPPLPKSEGPAQPKPAPPSKGPGMPPGAKPPAGAKPVKEASDNRASHVPPLRRHAPHHEAPAKGTRPRPASPSHNETEGATRPTDPLLIPDQCIRARVVQVPDGDTLTLQVGRAKRQVHLWGIEAPALCDPFGGQAKRELSRKVRGKIVEVLSHGADESGRILVEIRPQGKDMAEELLRRGLARCLRQVPGSKRHEWAEQEAREGHRGMWAQGAHQPAFLCAPDSAEKAVAHAITIDP
jgi:endonuclease YncB( thermonuclease family)